MLPHNLCVSPSSRSCGAIPIWAFSLATSPTFHRHFAPTAFQCQESGIPAERYQQSLLTRPCCSLSIEFSDAVKDHLSLSPLHRSVLAATLRSRATAAPKIDFRLEKLLLNQHHHRHSQSLPSSPGVKTIPTSWTASPSTKMRTSTMPFARCRTRGRSPRSTSPCTPWRMARK